MDKTDLIEKIADKGDDLETLKALRQKIAKTIDESKSGRDIASLSRQLQIVMTQISDLEEVRKSREDDTVLEIIRRKHGQTVRNSIGQGYFDPDLEDDDLVDIGEESDR